MGKDVHDSRTLDKGSEMGREIVTTADGSHTVKITEMNVTYHSHYGAIQESLHVFVQAGLIEVFQRFAEEPIRVFEMGFGTGLNALLTALEAGKESRKVQYTAVEIYPLSLKETDALNYSQLLPGSSVLFQKIHQCNWKEEIFITEHFSLDKQPTDVTGFSTRRVFHLVYFDAFAPGIQPELWTETIFKKLYDLLVPGGVLVTYCSKSDVRRAMMAAGFTVKKWPGPPGKREMVRAEKV